MCSLWDLSFLIRDRTRSPCIGSVGSYPLDCRGSYCVFFFFFNAILVCLHSFYLCMYVWLCWVFVSVRGLSLAAASGGHSSSRCAGLPPSRPLVAEHRLQTRRLSSCGSRAELLRGMWDLPRPGLEPASPPLAGRFSTTAPPGKPKHGVLTTGLPGKSQQIFLI